MHPNVHSPTVYNSQVLEATQVPISKWVDQKMWYIYKMEYHAAEGKKELLPFANSMDRTGEHYVKWSKPGSETQIPWFHL